jgi:hypothetical protein
VIKGQLKHGVKSNINPATVNFPSVLSASTCQFERLGGRIILGAKQGAI